VILSRNYRVEEAAILWYFALDIGNRLFSVFSAGPRKNTAN
jgi:hypothetical protein